MKILNIILSSLAMTEGRRHHHGHRESHHHGKSSLLDDFVRDPEQSRIDILQFMEFHHHTSTPSRSLKHWNHPISCGLCKVGLKPIDWFFESPTIRKGLERVALSVCEHKGIYGGVPSVCKGAIDMMAGDVLPALAESVFSPMRICDEDLGLCNNPNIKDLSA